MSLRKGTMPIGLLPHLLLFWHGSDAFFWNTLSSSLWTFRCNLPSTKTPRTSRQSPPYHASSPQLQASDPSCWYVWQQHCLYRDWVATIWGHDLFGKKKGCRLGELDMMKSDEVISWCSLVSRCLQQVTTGSPSCMFLLLWIGSSANSRTAAIPKSARFGSSNALATEINAATPTKTQKDPKK